MRRKGYTVCVEAMQITSLNISSSLNQVAEKIRDKVSQASNIRQRIKKKLTECSIYQYTLSSEENTVIEHI